MLAATRKAKTPYTASRIQTTHARNPALPGSAQQPGRCLFCRHRQTLLSPLRGYIWMMQTPGCTASLRWRTLFKSTLCMLDSCSIRYRCRATSRIFAPASHLVRVKMPTMPWHLSASCCITPLSSLNDAHSRHHYALTWRCHSKYPLLGQRPSIVSSFNTQHLHIAVSPVSTDSTIANPKALVCRSCQPCISTPTYLRMSRSRLARCTVTTRHVSSPLLNHSPFRAHFTSQRHRVLCPDRPLRLRQALQAVCPCMVSTASQWPSNLKPPLV